MGSDKTYGPAASWLSQKRGRAVLGTTFTYFISHFRPNLKDKPGSYFCQVTLSQCNNVASLSSNSHGLLWTTLPHPQPQNHLPYCMLAFFSQYMEREYGRLQEAPLCRHSSGGVWLTLSEDDTAVVGHKTDSSPSDLLG